MAELQYHGKTIPYQSPLGIFLDKGTSGRVNDIILPKYREIDPTKFSDVDSEIVRDLNQNAERQLAGIAQKDTEGVRRALRNTIDLTKRLLEVV